jgi:hypothetical protein
LIILIILGEEYKLWTFFQYNLFKVKPVKEQILEATRYVTWSTVTRISTFNDWFLSPMLLYSVCCYFFPVTFICQTL